MVGSGGGHFSCCLIAAVRHYTYGSQKLSFFVTPIFPMKNKPLRQVPRVALLVETTRTYTRELLSGVRRYVAAHGPWSTFLELRALDSSPPSWLRPWDGDGILTRTFTPEMADLIEETGLPAVELRSTNLSGGRPFVGMDNAHIGRAIAGHFYERGYRCFGVYSLQTELFFCRKSPEFRQSGERLWLSLFRASGD